MRERPIPFSAPMVRAILDGTKTQTRRVAMHTFCGLRVARLAYDPPPELSTCPYGVPGDRLWVREAWRASSAHDHLAPRDIPVGDAIEYDADPQRALTGKLRQGMFMPRWASRITLAITGVRVERLQDISGADALAEGISLDGARPGHDIDIDGSVTAAFAIGRYRALWDTLNAARFFGWDANPWVWVVAFDRVEGRA